MADTDFDAVAGSLNNNLPGYMDVSNMLLSVVHVNTTWTATDNGWVYVGGNGDGSSGSSVAYIDNVEVFRTQAYGNQWNSAIFPIKKGQVLKLTKTGNANIVDCWVCGMLH